ncbi:hypothetical protein SPI_03044 [Niveomyces insectorum RCEF 264]|uniref:Uncharacterized protein n=1 Tax=Niveomyces insectorum RCEF 264 TaxID=1081102 RepID=A0A167X0W0_9HYPO|nr:hypothetical protein SPI_03044 [Niveomyces insectorum RCEF 264]
MAFPQAASTSPPAAAFSSITDGSGASESSSYHFTTVENFFQIVSTGATDDYLSFHGVSEDDFEAIDAARGNHRPGFRVRRFLAEPRVLYITVPSGVHEVMHSSLHEQIVLQVAQAGLHSEWFSFARTTFRANFGRPGEDAGEGDSTGGPKPARLFKGAWPTLVIEAGVSETTSALQKDMRWWFSASEHDVKIVLLLHLDRTQQSIVLERWEEEASSLSRPGATTTRRAAEVEPVQRQTITITKDAVEERKLNVANGDLVLSFRLLFLRDPRPGEGDIIVTGAGLETCAENVWGVCENVRGEAMQVEAGRHDKQYNAQDRAESVAAK